MAADHEDVTFEKVDATNALERANTYGVRSVPSTIILTDDDTVISKFDGLTQADDITAVF